MEVIATSLPCSPGARRRPLCGGRKTLLQILSFRDAIRIQQFTVEFQKSILGIVSDLAMSSITYGDLVEAARGGW